MQCSHCNHETKQLAITPHITLYRCPHCRARFEIPNKAGTRQLSFACFDHQGKSNALVSALETKYQRLTPRDDVYFVLSDSDVSARAAQMGRMNGRGCKRFFVYPHTARPSLVNAAYQTWQHTTAQIVVNEYHGEVLRAYGYEKPLIYSGWYLSSVEQLKPRDVAGRAINVLFAPIHPRNAEQDRAANKATFDILATLAQAGEINLTVRYIGEIQESGLSFINGVTFTRGEMNQATEQMDTADVVIGHQTFAWLAVARGIPCVMFAEDMPTHFRVNNKYFDVPCWDKVAPLFQYPLDILEARDKIGLLRQAATNYKDIQMWKRRMIGEPFDAMQFVERIEAFL